MEVMKVYQHMLIVGMILPSIVFSAQDTDPPHHHKHVPFYIVRLADGTIQGVQVQFPADVNTRESRVSFLINEMLHPGASYSSIFPLGTRFDNVSCLNDTCTLFFTFPSSFLTRLNDGWLEPFIEHLSTTVANVPGVKRIHVLVRPDNGRKYREISDYLPPLPPVPAKEDVYGIDTNRLEKFVSLPGQPPGFGQDQPSGALSGKTIFLSPGHGWYWHSTNGWITQRGNTNSLVEDFHTAETIDSYLVQYLWNMGADVWVVRERGMTTQELIVDNDGNNTDGTYTEIGPWFNSTLSGFANGYEPYTTQDPFELGGNRLVACDASVSAKAIYTFQIPSSGYYPVYVSYSQYSSRAPDAHYVVKHAGGTSHFRINQTIHGFTWRYLGTFYFDAGASPDNASVELWNDCTSGKYISADAVRLGAGTGVILRGSSVSGRPKFEEAARYYVQYMGGPASTYDPCGPSYEDNCDDVTARPRWSEFEKASGEDAVYVSLHTNAGGGTGTSTYIHDTSPTPGSVELQNAIHNELINDIRNGWDPAWTDRGKLSADFGELRLLSTMPGVLIELAFHDNPDDANDLKEAEFRRLSARAIAQGIARYFNPAAVLPPEPPTHFAVLQSGPQEVTLTWQAPPDDPYDVAGDPPTKYKVYISTHPKAFSQGVETTSTSYVVTGLTPGTIYYFRVTSVNSGGESFPTETLSARLDNGQASLLIVNGFDRIDKYALLPRYESSALGTIMRMVLDRMNSYDYVTLHAKAIGANNVSFVSSSNEALLTTVQLSSFCGVDWILGEESTVDETFSAQEQNLVSSYLNNGGHLFVSGAEIGWDLVARGSADDTSFYENELKAQYVADDAYAGQSSPANTVTGTSGGVYNGLSSAPFDGTGDFFYSVNYPDAIAPAPGGTLELQYLSANSGAEGAGVSFKGTFRIMNWGFPFESLINENDRTIFMERTLSFLSFLPIFSTPVQNLRARKSGNDVILSWDAYSAEPLGYKTYCSNTPTGPWDASTECTTLDGDGIPSNTTYVHTNALNQNSNVYYQITAWNCSGNAPF